KKIIDGRTIDSGDVVLGLASSGPHSNGYSLIRKLFSKEELKKDINLFLKPTTLYVMPLLDVIKKYKVKGIVNITGGGLYENIPRVLPKNKKVLIKRNSWDLPKVFQIIKQKTVLSERELHTTFNMGIGMVLIMKKDQAIKTKQYLEKKYKQKSWIIGEVKSGKACEELV
ncbi:MAG: phosphoribosylformylglycinamidine cyclo-ligase, partial [Candidatus Omnitrophica bacterium]|nr:phosphoribosylformylglycinamidine cyclo-ligase [Candidatus Omnitrophota bacterium]